MGSFRRNLLKVLITLIILFSVLLLPLADARPLDDGNEWLIRSKEDMVLQLQSLRGTVPPSGPSCTTTIPNNTCP
uniref:Uncharacterized protein n=1 Tax=Nelumbo nucifera TaxID=4432 RepID=A0A822Z137_NELNU|nr:TPA_asm: hypothetical protein HUJ06_007347 [Nelumbo nucifera]